jgi:hypothetical protein
LHAEVRASFCINNAQCDQITVLLQQRYWNAPCLRM